jgi:hypothetical protein
MSLYTPTIQRFGARANVSRDDVRAEKKRLLMQLSGVRRFEIHNLRITRLAGGNVATAIFRTDWVTDGLESSGQSVTYCLRLRRVGDGWRIESEEQLTG